MKQQIILELYEICSCQNLMSLQSTTLSVCLYENPVRTKMLAIVRVEKADL